jgi:hypothetical protein
VGPGEAAFPSGGLGANSPRKKKESKKFEETAVILLCNGYLFVGDDVIPHKYRLYLQILYTVSL